MWLLRSSGLMQAKLIIGSLLRLRSSVILRRRHRMFTKYELYATTESIYCYRGTTVLRNRLDIRENGALKAAEEEITAVKQYQLLLNPIAGRFSKTHLCRIHRFLFEDVYPFAGRLRREQIGKADTLFYPPAMIDRELNKICTYIQKENCFSTLDCDPLVDRLAFTMAELNIIHPFREGNGRAIREFIRTLALHDGYLLNWGLTSRDELLEASIQSVDDYRALIPVLQKCIQS